MTRSLLLLLFALFVCGCSQSNPIPDLKLSNQTLTNANLEDLGNKLNELDTVLQNVSPKVHARLLPPADDDSIRALREALGDIQNDYLELWFTWHDGSTGGSAGLLPLGGALTSSEAIADRELNRSIPGLMPRRHHDIKLLDDGAGDGFFLDLSSPHGNVYYEMLEDPFPQSYGNFSQFLDFLHAVHKAGIADINPRGVVVFDESAYRSLEANHFGEIGR